MIKEGAVVTATIELKFEVCGDLEHAIRNGLDDEAYSIAHSIVRDMLDHCGYIKNDMRVEEIEYELIQ